MNDLDAVFQLVFFVLIVLGWVIKAVVDAKQKKQRGSAPKPPSVDPGVSRPVPGRPPPHRAPAPAPSHTPLSADARLGHLGDAMAERTLDSSAYTSGPQRVLHSSAAAIAHGAQTRRTRRASALRRLSGGLPVVPGRDLTRAGVLWSEILGPCRALQGPHRSPAAKRIRRA